MHNNQQQHNQQITSSSSLLESNNESSSGMSASVLNSRHLNRIKTIINHLSSPPPNNQNNNYNNYKSGGGGNLQQQHFSNHVVSMKPFRTLHTGIIHDPDAVFERKKPLRLELRKSFYTSTQSQQEQQQSPNNVDSTNKTISNSSSGSSVGGGGGGSYPYTSILILDHVFHIAKLLNSRHIHLKYVEQSGDTYIMFRTDQGLVPYSTIQNKHWIKYLLMHATGKEEYEKAGEGEFRLEVMTERDGRLDFTVNIVYIQGGVKLTLSFINV